MDRWGVFLKDYTAGSGYQGVVYLAQSVNNEDMLQYDFGDIKNMETYGQRQPAKVPLENITVPTALFVGTLDKLATVADNEKLASILNPDTLKWH